MAVAYILGLGLIIFIICIISHVVNGRKRMNLIKSYNNGNMGNTETSPCDCAFATHTQDNITLCILDNESITKKLNIENFRVSSYYGSPLWVSESWTYIAFDNTNRNILIAEFYKKNITHRIIPYKDIVGVEILQDDVVISKKSTSRTIGGALVGGVLFGGAGAVVGGLSGDAELSKEVKSMKLKILVNDLDAPVITTTWGKNLKADVFNESYINSLLDKPHRIKDTITVIINLIDKEEGADVSSTNNNVVSVADEISKLSKLKNEGIITEKEFTVQKDNILKKI